MARWKLLAFTLMTWLVLTVAPIHVTYAGQNANFKVENVTGQVGETVSVKIDMLNDVDFLSGNFTIDYDPTRLEYVNYRLDKELEEKYNIVVNSIKQQGKIKIGYLTKKLEISYLKNAGNMMTVEFTIKDKALYENKVIFSTQTLKDSNGETVEAPKTTGIVYRGIPLVSAELNTKSINLFKGESSTLVLTYSPVTTTENTTISWSSSDEKVAKVSNKGVVTAIGEGKATIYSKIGNITNTCEVNVTDLEAIAENVELDRQSETMILGDTDTFVPLYIPESLTNTLQIIWSSSDEDVAIVQDGVVTAIGEGTVVITMNVQGVEKECVITVRSKILKGDLNEDGKITADDAACVIEFFKTGRYSELGDMNNDGKLNAEDAALIIDIFKTGK